MRLCVTQDDRCRGDEKSNDEVDEDEDEGGKLKRRRPGGGWRRQAHVAL